MRVIVSFMKEQYRQIVRQKITDSLAAPMPVSTHRDVWMPSVPGKSTAVIGMRRAGKTTLLWQVLAKRLKNGTKRDSLLYFSFEDERLAGMQAGDLDLLVEEYFRLHPEWRDMKKVTFFLDEIQTVPEWEIFARRLLDSENIDIFISGSSARLLSREVATSMRGRAMEAVVFPFSFRESLRHTGQEPKKTLRKMTKAQNSFLYKALLEYLTCGGFPEAQGLDLRNRAELLRGYVDIVLLRDVVERHSVSRPQILRWMVRQLLGNAAGMFSVNKFYRDLKSQGFAVGKDTLHEYLSHLEDAFLVSSISLDTETLRRKRVNPRKVYPVDTGLVPFFDRSNRGNLGHKLETVVFLELKRRGTDICYVRTENGFEVDFFARYLDGKEELIQVSVSVDDAETRNREIRALLDAAKLHPDATLLLVVLDKPSVVEIPDEITLITAGNWLLSQPFN